jgi:hypothetical protein
MAKNYYCRNNIARQRPTSYLINAGNEPRHISFQTKLQHRQIHNNAITACAARVSAPWRKLW